MKQLTNTLEKEGFIISDDIDDPKSQKAFLTFARRYTMRILCKKRDRRGPLRNDCL